MDIIQNQSSGQEKINFINESDYAKTTPVNNENKTLHLGADKKSEPDFTFDKKTNNIDFENGNAENFKEENTAVEGGEKQINKEDISSNIQEGQEKQVQPQEKTTSQVGQEREQEKSDQSNEKPQNPIKPLKVYGSEYETSDEEEISYYKTMLRMLSIKCGLVGRFTRTGKYIIPDEIKTDLVKINKEISDSGENFYKANTQYMRKNFFFVVRMEMIDDVKAKASLYLQEEADNVFAGQYLTSHIADFVDDYNEYFRINVRKVFNLLDVAIINEDYRVPNLAVLLQDYIDLELFVAGLYDTACQIYLLKMLKLLEEEGGEEGLEILKRYKELIAHLEIEKMSGKYKYTNYKNMLDKAILEKGGLQKLPVAQNKVKEIVKEMNKSVKSIEDLKLKPGAIEVMKPKDVKKETQESQPKSSKPKKATNKTSTKTSTPKVKATKAKGAQEEGEEWEPFDFGDNRASNDANAQQGDQSQDIGQPSSNNAPNSQISHSQPSSLPQTENSPARTQSNFETVELGGFGGENFQSRNEDSNEIVQNNESEAENTAQIHVEHSTTIVYEREMY